MAIYQYNRRFFVRNITDDSFIEAANISRESETNIIYNDNELEKEQFAIIKEKEEYKLPDGYYYYQDPVLSHKRIDLNEETSFNIFFNIGIVEEYKKKEIELRPMYIGYMINDRGDMLFKIEDIKDKLDRYVHTVYTWPLDRKTNFLPLVNYKGENYYIKGKGINYDIVDTMYSPSSFDDAGKGWVKFGDPWFIALSNNKGYKNKTIHLRQYCVKMNQFDDGYNIVHSVYKGVGFIGHYFDELKLLNKERKEHGREPIEINEQWYEENRSFYVFREPKIIVGYDELDPVENVEKYRHKKTNDLPIDIRIDPTDFNVVTEEISGDEHKFNLKLPYDYYFILTIKIKDNKKITRVAINNVIVFEDNWMMGYDYVKEYVLNSLNQTSSSYNNLRILNFNVELEQGENIITKENCSVDLEVHLIQSSVDYV